jgi:hypothetical protein
MHDTTSEAQTPEVRDPKSSLAVSAT